MSSHRKKRSSAGQVSGPLIAGKIIGDALRKKADGDSSEYDVIVSKLCAQEVDSVQLQRWLNGLRCCISKVGQNCDKLVGATLQLSWAYREKDAVIAYSEYLHDLVAAHAQYLSPCVFMLVKLFIYYEDRSEEQNQLAFERSMSCLSHLLDLVPVGLHCVKQHLVTVCPYKGRSPVIQEHFVRNCLRLIDFFPVLMGDIVEMLVDHLMKVDLDVSKEDLEEELKQPDESPTTVFQLEMDTADDASSAAATASAENAACAPMANVLAQKLDICMMHMVNFIRKHSHHASGEFHLDGATAVFQALCKVFQKVLLMTHGTSHVQFLIFYICSAHQSFTEGFLHLLWSKVEDVNGGAVTRQAAAAYMSSFVARAKYIPLSTVTLCLDLMSEWVLKYIHLCDSSARSIPDVNAHSVFFSVVQAILYIFIYRHKALLGMDDGWSFLQSMQFERIVTCRLNPLKVCLSNIVEVFAAITSKHEIVFCHTIVARNRRIVMPPACIDANNDKAIHLGSFFPFDPYLLKQSGSFFEDLYTQWKDICPEQPSSSSSAAGSAAYESRQDSRGAESVPIPFSDAAEESPSFDSQMIALNLTPLSPMCISPGFDKFSFS
eukprot:scpid50579/ scgid29360/ RNA polymerase I-specific transcription initiation factor RRN3; Transcription initiation factor IA